MKSRACTHFSWIFGPLFAARIVLEATPSDALDEAALLSGPPLLWYGFLKLSFSFMVKAEVNGFLSEGAEPRQ